MAISTDVIIIGGGPAGLSTALHLLQLDPGWAERMMVLEKEAHPRPKLCGGGVTRFGLQILENLGFGLPLPLLQAQVEEARFIYAGRTIHVRGQPMFSVFHRPTFDAYLAEQARARGVQLFENTPVKDLEVAPNGVQVVTSRGIYKAQVIIGADGSKGLTRTFLNRRSDPKQIARLLEIVDPAPESSAHFRDRYAVFDFNPVKRDLQGYFWEFPSKPDGRAALNTGVYDARIAHQRPRANLPRILSAALASNGSSPGSLAPKGHPIHWFSPRTKFSTPRILLVGDAAGVEPLFGEGIAPALAYGQLAANCVNEAFGLGDFSFNGYRRALLRSALGRFMLLRWSLAWWGYHLSWSRIYMHLLWTIGDVLARVWPASSPLYTDDRIEASTGV